MSRAVRLLVLVLVPACSPADDYKVTPGGMNPGGSGDDEPPSDAAPPAADAFPFDARVCVLLDPRDRLSCTTTGLAGLTVRIGGVMTTTADDGAFSILVPAGATTWRVSGPGLVPSVIPFDGSLRLPALTTDRYMELALANGVPFADGEGGVFVRATRDGNPISGVTVALGIGQPSETRYDDVDPLVWDDDATGAQGVAWIPDAPVRAASTVTVTSELGGERVVMGVPVENLALTFLTVDVP